MALFDLVLLFMIVITAFLSLQLKDALSSAVCFGTYSFLMCLIWVIMGAVDVAFTEATVGAGVSTVFIVAVLYHVERQTTD